MNHPRHKFGLESNNLTPAEIKILKYTYDGNSNKDLSELCHISVKTVETHTTNAIRKIRALNQSGFKIINKWMAARWAFEQGFFQPRKEELHYEI